MSFDLIGDGLVWKVGNGVDVCIGFDPWVGCKSRHLLPLHMIDRLHNHGFYFLKDIDNPWSSFLLDQGWLSSNNVGIVDIQDVLIWNDYTTILKANNIRLFDSIDELVWIHSKSGNTLLKLVSLSRSRIGMMMTSFGGGKQLEI